MATLKILRAHFSTSIIAIIEAALLRGWTAVRTRSRIGTGVRARGGPDGVVGPTGVLAALKILRAHVITFVVATIEAALLAGWTAIVRGATWARGRSASWAASWARGGTGDGRTNR